MARTRKAGGGEDMAELVLKVAGEFFAVKDVHRTSLAEIASAAGISAPSLLYHFPSKDELYREVIARFYRDLEDTLDRELTSELPPASKFPAALLNLKRFELENRRLIALVVREFTGPDSLARPVLEKHAPRLMAKAELLLRRTFDPPLHPAAPVREVIIQIMISHLARVAHGSLAVDIWGTQDHSMEITQVLLRYLRNWPQNP